MIEIMLDLMLIISLCGVLAGYRAIKIIDEMVAIEKTNWKIGGYSERGLTYPLSFCAFFTDFRLTISRK